MRFDVSPLFEPLVSPLEHTFLVDHRAPTGYRVRHNPLVLVQPRIYARSYTFLTQDDS
jgi:hypothetical protein